MKKIITVTMIKNEADIVESFVRYTMNFASKMIFIDNGCVDGSAEILKELIAEGYNIEVYLEAEKFYDQYLIENKYIRKITNENMFDFLIPLDVDEFVSSKEGILEQIELLPDDRVIFMNWKTYCLSSEQQEGFFLDTINCLRIDKENIFRKIILPYEVLKRNRIFVTMGHHDIESETEIARIYQEKIYIAHFPVRKLEQIRLKVYQGIIGQLMSSYHNAFVFQWKKMHGQLAGGTFDIVKYSKEYALLENQISDSKYVESKFDYSWCNAPIIPKYEKLQKQDTLEAIYEILQVVAIKSIIDFKNKGKKVLIYGTGRTARELFDCMSEEKYNILAYIDSDVKKEYSKFKNKLVLAPDKIKYLEYDLVIIASVFFDEIYEILLQLGVSKNKIFSRFDIIDEQIRR